MILNSSTDYSSGKHLLLRRTYAAPIHRVFQAWVDPGDLSRWFTPDPAQPARVTDIDVRHGGGFTAAFGPAGETPWIERLQYLDIDPPHRLLMLGHMTRDGDHVFIGRYDLSLAEVAGGTELVLKETGCAPDNLADRAGGWGGTLDNLASVLG